MTVGRFSRQGYKGQPEFRSVPDFCRGQRFHNRTLVRARNGRAFFFQGEERLADGRPADFGRLKTESLKRIPSRDFPASTFQSEAERRSPSLVLRLLIGYKRECVTL